MTKFDAGRKPLISVVIATRNEAKHIANIIDSLQSQTYKNLEIIVVNNSTDTETQKIAQSKGVIVYDLSLKLKEIRGVKNYRGYQVNYGVKQSKGEIIFFPDADMTFDTNLLKEIAGLCLSYQALYIPEVIIGKGLFGKVRNYEREFYNQTPIDAIRVITKDLYKQIGGYDEKNIVFGPDDWDLTKMVKKRTSSVSITKNKLYHHEENMTWKDLLKKKKKYADTFEGYIVKWGRNDPDVQKQLGFYYRYLGVYTENGKWAKIIKYPHLALLMYSLRLVIGLNYSLNLLKKGHV